MVIAKRDREDVWHITDPADMACAWTPPDDGDLSVETGTLGVIVAAVDGQRCDDCDW